MAQHRRREAGGKVQEGSPSASPSVDPQFAHPVAEPGDGERLAGQEAGEEPGDRGRCAHSDIAPACGGEPVDESAKRFGDCRLLVAEPKPHAVTASDHVVELDGDDRLSGWAYSSRR
jgi:hypothetical protein